MSESDKMTITCGKKTNNPFFNFLRCYRTRADRQHRSAVENAVSGAREWNKMTEEQRKPFVEMAAPFLKPEAELKYPRRPSVGRKSRRRRRRTAKRSTTRRRSTRRRSTARTKRSTAGRARSRSRRRTVKSRATSRRRKTKTTRSRTRKTTTKRRTRSRGSRSRSRAGTKRRTQACPKPFIDQQQAAAGVDDKSDLRRTSMQPPTCPRPACQMPPPTPHTSATVTPQSANRTSCDLRNMLTKECETSKQNSREE
ncbi:serine/arginine repetitive matrix protein 2-like [Planococcus citri]|uniref:serine/arginine repetitive matrix protein 2-like n=1 Tax=Planococcus citri TaxID=170843 RepID=UPI0031F75DBC